MSRKNKLTGKTFENIEITDVAAEGKSIAKIDELVIFIPFGAPGDIVDVNITKHRRNFLEGFITKIRRESDARVKPFCEHFTVCGGCKWQHLEYSQQLKYKEQQVVDNLERIGKVNYDYELLPIIPSPDITFYRNKLEFTFSNRRWFYEDEISSNAEIKNPHGLGFHMPGYFDKIIDINKCWLQPEPSNQVRLAVKERAAQKGYDFFDIKKKEGFLRNLIIRNNLAGEFMVILVVFSYDREKIKNILDHLDENFPQVKSLYYIVNSKKNDSLDDLEPVLYKGDSNISETVDGLIFRTGAKSFYQTNSRQAETLYNIAGKFAGLSGSETVYDLYTGTGTIANFLDGKAKKVVGIEYVEEAVEHARANSHVNNIKNTEFISGDMSQVFNDELFAKHGSPDIIVTDPPRAGMHPKVLEQIKKTKAGKIVYVSCNPATQSRDIEMLSDIYKLTVANPVDMFPHTQHVENVALLERV